MGAWEIVEQDENMNFIQLTWADQLLLKDQWYTEPKF